MTPPQELPIEFRFSSRHVDTQADSDEIRPLRYHIKHLRFHFKGWIAVTFLPLSSPEAKLVVLFDKTTVAPKWVYFGAHGRGQGGWMYFRECDKTQDGKLKVYVSHRSTGLYPHPRRYWRMFGCANDVCGDDGNVWVPDIACRIQGSTSTVEDPNASSISRVARFCIAIPMVLHRATRTRRCRTFTVTPDKDTHTFCPDF
jgi:hypothetical protein